MQALRTFCGLALGLLLTATSMLALTPVPAPLAHALVVAARQAIVRPAPTAEVSVAFDPTGRPLAALHRSSGSRRSDEAAVAAALELASLRAPADVAGRTVLVRARFE